MINQLKRIFKPGDRVIFDKSKIEVFKNETTGSDKAIKQYQQLILEGVDQIGIVKEFGENLTTISYPDGWDLPVPKNIFS